MPTVEPPVGQEAGKVMRRELKTLDD